MSFCCHCGRDDLPLHDVGCVNPNVRACAVCIARLGKRLLKEAADQALAFLFTPAGKAVLHPSFRCGHCPNIVQTGLDGRTPVLCDECNRERLAVIHAA